MAADGASSPRTLLEQLKADPWTVDRVEGALAPYARLVSPAKLAWIREQMFEQLANDPHGHRLLRRAHPQVVAESGDVGWPAAVEDAAPAGRRKTEAG
jgi:hypothetical protein